MIYQGRPGGFVGINPKIVKRTQVTVGQVPSYKVPDLGAGSRSPPTRRPRATSRASSSRCAPCSQPPSVLLDRHASDRAGRDDLDHPDVDPGDLRVASATRPATGPTARRPDMAGRIRWLGVAMVVCFLALFLQLNNMQVKKAHTYANYPVQPVGGGGQIRPAPGHHPERRRRGAGPVGADPQGRLQVRPGVPPGVALRSDHGVPVVHLRRHRGRGHLRLVSRPAQPARQDDR